MTLTQNAAETLALQALSWLAADGELLPIFLGASGLSESDLRAGIEQPEVLGGVLDFILMDDAWVVAFCDQAGIAYERVAQARQALPGGAQVNWT
ncbi:DUF3572 domain-containing protein [Sulfitobacter sp. S190]|uniref:DUF3572 domain-containing protein n=1 Tax=Sulfitobacter sp. S190 TaxID=2867022 RepID=UPI0021A82328|nr:DUF3572 domain-containing protein [Sulfitobacter sp. S190]UWR23503.1 DUF3572 domain-containing protein [Sulfitobacter sp. S190]